MMIKRAALDPARRDIGKRIGGDIRSDYRFPDDGSPQGIIDRRGQHRRRRRFAGAGLEMHAGFPQQFVGVAEHVHQMGDGRALISPHIGDAGLQQRLGHRENAFAAEIRARAKAKLFHFSLEGALCHSAIPTRKPRRGAGCRNRP